LRAWRGGRIVVAWQDRLSRENQRGTAEVWEALEPEENWDSGYAIWASEPDWIGNSELVHLGCLLEDFPDLEPSLQYAREHGEWIKD
jgi:hypothetical protein